MHTSHPVRNLEQHCIGRSSLLVFFLVVGAQSPLMHQPIECVAGSVTLVLVVSMLKSHDPDQCSQARSGEAQDKINPWTRADGRSHKSRREAHVAFYDDPFG